MKTYKLVGACPLVVRDSQGLREIKPREDEQPVEFTAELSPAQEAFYVVIGAVVVVDEASE